MSRPQRRATVRSEMPCDGSVDTFSVCVCASDVPQVESLRALTPAEIQRSATASASIATYWTAAFRARARGELTTQALAGCDAHATVLVRGLGLLDTLAHQWQWQAPGAVPRLPADFASLTATTRQRLDAAHGRALAAVLDGDCSVTVLYREVRSLLVHKGAEQAPRALARDLWLAVEACVYEGRAEGAQLAALFWPDMASWCARQPCRTDAPMAAPPPRPVA